VQIKQGDVLGYIPSVPATFKPVPQPVNLIFYDLNEVNRGKSSRNTLDSVKEFTRLVQVRVCHMLLLHTMHSSHLTAYVINREQNKQAD
jgi:hypothetical protein